MRVGVVMLPTDPWPETVQRARRLERLGYDHLWTYDHLSWRRYRERTWHAAIPWLTGLAGATSGIRLGTMVASPNFRHPLTLAKEVTTLDHVSGGRITLGLGAGGIGFDATVFGHALLTPGERVDRLEEFVAIVDCLLREPVVSHDGPHYTIDEARMIPGCVQQPRVPLAVAAGGPRTLAIVARYADAWITYGDTSERVRTAAETERVVREQALRLGDAAVAIGRDPGTIDRIYMAGNGEERPLASIETFREMAGRYRELGFTDFVFHHPRADDPEWDDPEDRVEQIATEVLADLR
jgi:alkanesulfonate monooxygenase SsuD/methylene tetrahydromethanopterin reductase-like flavin-dependent oxidoreductase (luciferase family)